MFVKCYTSTISGISAAKVTVEVNISKGIGLYLVGLPDNAIKESQERIRAAFDNSGLKMTGKKCVVNLAPASIRKEGSGYDLPIAISILAASGQCNVDKFEDYIIIGELSLNGDLTPIKGALPIAIEALADKFSGIILPKENANEAAVVEGLDVIGADNLMQVLSFLNDESDIEPTQPLIERNEHYYAHGEYEDDFSDVKGQPHVKRAIEIAASGGHNVIMIGSPGSGKTMLAKRIPTIIPPLSVSESLETTKIHSVAGKLGAQSGLLKKRPFRAPHHLTSQVALVGGGASPQPGEISLAHNGILFLDELPEFGRNMLEVLRQPLEDKKIVVSRVKYTVEYPANFILVASMNPCPCGYFNHPTRACVCSRSSVHRYINRISGPLLDRIDMHIEVTPVDNKLMVGDGVEEGSHEILRRVVEAREIQAQRFSDCKEVHTNAMMNSKMIRKYCKLTPESATLLERAMARLSLSARAHDRIVKVARTIADMSRERDILPGHIAEAIGYRSLDRENWGR